MAIGNKELMVLSLILEQMNSKDKIRQDKGEEDKKRRINVEKCAAGPKKQFRSRNSRSALPPRPRLATP